MEPLSTSSATPISLQDSGMGDFDIKEEKDVALKIMTITGSKGEDEYSMQKEIIRTVQDTSNLVTYHI
jgi:hypothetical protein